MKKLKLEGSVVLSILYFIIVSYIDKSKWNTIIQLFILPSSIMIDLIHA